MIDAAQPPDDRPGGPPRPECRRCNGTGVEPDTAPSDAPAAHNGQEARETDGQVATHGKMGKPTCGRRTKSCSKCGRRYSKDERKIWKCPDCGNPRACSRSPTANRPAGAPCKFHGGMTLPAGPMHPSWKHGRYSKAMPDLLRKSYERAAADPEYTSLRDELAVLSSLIEERIGRLAEVTASNKLWKKLRENCSRLDAARAAKDTDKMAKLLTEQDRLIKRGATFGRLIEEIMGLVEGKGRVSRTEFQRLRDERQLMTQERAMAIIVSMAASIREHVSNPDEVRAIAYDISLLMDHRGKADTGAVVDAEFSETDEMPTSDDTN